MPLNLKSIFSSGAEKLIKSVGDAFDRNFTNNEEREAAKLELTKELNRHLEAIQDQSLKQAEIEFKDIDSARQRDIETVKAGRKHDPLMIVTGLVALALSILTVIVIFFFELKNETLAHFIAGEILGIFSTILAYYFGTSRGSKDKDALIKDMARK